MEEILRETMTELEAGRPCVLVTVIEAIGHSPARVGAKLLVRSDGSTTGTVGGGVLEQLCTERAQTVLEHGESAVERYALDQSSPRPGAAGEGSAVSTETGCGGEVLLFFEILGTSTLVHLFGGGHIGRYLAYHLAPLYFRLHLHEDRTEILDGFPEQPRLTKSRLSLPSDLHGIPPEAFVVVATHSHDLDYEIVKGLLSATSPPRYIGVVASRKKWRLFRSRLEAELVGTIDHERLYAPCGLNIASRRPEEIALAIAAEILAVRERTEAIHHMRDVAEKE